MQLLLIASGLAAIAVIVALGVSLRGEQAGNESTLGGAREVSIEEIRSLATSKGHPLYWAGPLPARKLELTDNQRGEVFVRYLPARASIGTRSPVFTVIGTYPVAQGALDAATQAAGRRGMISRKVPGGALAVWSRRRPNSVYMAYPGSPLLIEIFDPDAKQARALAFSGRVQPV